MSTEGFSCSLRFQKLFSPLASIYTVRHKKQQIFYNNLKKSDPILISFGTNISDTTGHQMTV